MSGPEQMAPDATQVLDRTVNGCESLQLGRRSEAPHLAFPLPRWLMGGLGSVVGVLRGAVLDRQHRAVGSGVAGQFVGD